MIIEDKQILKGYFQYVNSIPLDRVFFIHEKIFFVLLLILNYEIKTLRIEIMKK